MKTAEEFIEYQEDHYADKKWIMIEFARYHIKEALKQAYFKHEINTINGHNEDVYELDESSILNAYPLENIK